jgi:teichuronic acid exporter
LERRNRQVLGSTEKYMPKIEKNLRADTIEALFWSFLERFGAQGIQFIISIFLARLLLPEDFGLVAMLSIFIAIGHAFINGGFGQALIQKKDVAYIDECSVFYFNILIAFLSATLLFVVAPLIGDFYDSPRLVPITRLLSLTFILNSFGLVQRTLLSKSLDFKTQFKVSVLASTLSGALSVTLALNDVGVWSLVALMVGSELFSTVFLWYFCSWKPSLKFSFNSLKSMFSFGSRLFLVSLINSVFENIYQLIIGKYFSTSALGFYSRANSLYKYPVTMLNSVVSQVSFPVFSKIQNKKEQLKNATKKSLTMIVLITFPLMVGLAVVANPLVIILLTEKWLLSVPYLQLLCIIGMLYPIQVINLNVLNAQGRSDLFLKIIIINKILILIAVVVTYRFGIIAMIYGQIVNSFIAYYLYAYYTGVLLKYSIFMQIKDMSPIIVVSFIMGVTVNALKYYPFSSQLALLIIQIITGVFIYTGFCYLFKISAFIEILQILKTFNKQFKV